jgi:hypothetical protein
VDWFKLAEDKYNWQADVDMITDYLVPYRVEDF